METYILGRLDYAVESTRIEYRSGLVHYSLGCRWGSPMQMINANPERCSRSIHLHRVKEVTIQDIEKRGLHKLFPTPESSNAYFILLPLPVLHSSFVVLKLLVGPR